MGCEHGDVLRERAADRRPDRHLHELDPPGGWLSGGLLRGLHLRQSGEETGHRRQDGCTHGLAGGSGRWLGVRSMAVIGSLAGSRSVIGGVGLGVGGGPSRWMGVGE